MKRAVLLALALGTCLPLGEAEERITLQAEPMLVERVTAREWCKGPDVVRYDPHGEVEWQGPEWAWWRSVRILVDGKPAAEALEMERIP